METDKTTLKDLVIFEAEDEYSIFNKINFTITGRGKDALQHHLHTPLNSLKAILETQQSISAVSHITDQWPKQISNGTLLMAERFYEANIDPIPANPTALSVFSYKLLHTHDFSLVKYSVGHCFDFLKGMINLTEILDKEGLPSPLRYKVDEAKSSLLKTAINIIRNKDRFADLSGIEMLSLAHFLRYRYKHEMITLISIFASLDALRSMGLANEKLGLVMPEFTDDADPLIEAKSLFHLLVPQAVPYDFTLNKNKNFQFLTGANMAGKSTYIKSCGAAVYLAHVGMGVPAKEMRLSYFDGMLSNINVIDNIAKGESYFFNEVQRIKSTILKINDGRKWLILIDELFKGTNVQDAMKCSTTVIEGLLKIKNAIFIVSTHLYEIGSELSKHENILFNYFETSVADDRLFFSYQLKEGISMDRLGYLILKREGVVRMLEDL